jgi:type IV secretion system protein VirB5
MRFSRAPQRYGATPPAETPYQRAGQMWDERDGSARASAYSWRLAFFGCLLLAGASVAGNLWQSGQSRIAPYVVEVDRLGEARSVGPAQQDWEPTDAVLARALERFIIDVRSLASDPVVVRERWLDAYSMVTAEGRNFLDGYARAANPFGGIGQRTVSVQPTSVVRASDRSFRVDWVEQTFEHGALTDTSQWTAVLSLRRVKPKTKADLKRNPLGLFVDGVDWAEQTTARLAHATSPASPAPNSTPLQQGAGQP